jgi:hypothetical protein
MMEYAVICSHPRRGVTFTGLGNPWTTELASAQRTYHFLTTEARVQAKILADKNEESGFEGGNAPYYYWHNEYDGIKNRRYAIIEREVGEAKLFLEEDDYEHHSRR